MSDSVAQLERKIKVADDLHVVVRTLKSISASKINQYEKAIDSLKEYYKIIEIGLGACFREFSSLHHINSLSDDYKNKKTIIVVFGSDQGLVGNFNSIIADYTKKVFNDFDRQCVIWRVGDRLSKYFSNSKVQTQEVFILPITIKKITTFVGDILLKINFHDINSDRDEFFLFYNHRVTGSTYEPSYIKLLPLDNNWQQHLEKCPWPSNNIPQIISKEGETLKSLIREYLFVSIYKACTDSLASENASRLASMQRAEKNIKDSLLQLNDQHQRLRQNEIDEELFDVISGFEAISKKYK